MNDKLRAAVYGLAVGDALGVPVEFEERGSFHVEGMTGFGSHHQKSGTWSDDTSMTLACCDSIKHCGGVDIGDMRARFRRWMNEGDYAIGGKVFDVGCTTAEALCSGEGKSHERANGNGSLMRILPLAFTRAGREEIEAVSAITHAHPISKAACVCYVEIARGLLAGKSLAEAFDALADCPFERLRDIGKLEEREIRSGGYVVSTLEASLWCLATTDSYREAVLKAVNLGGDTDTTAAVTGGLAGIIYGLESIPEEWLDALQGREIIEACLF